MKKLLLFLMLLLPSLCFGQGVVLSPQPAMQKGIDGRLIPMPFAIVTVCPSGVITIPCAPILNGAVFSDPALTQQKTNPFFADSLGNYSMALAPGNFTVTVTSSFGTNGYSYQITTTCPLAGTCTWTGVQTFASGIIVSSWSSTAANPAQTGVLKLGSGDQICWRNAANTGDLCLVKNNSDLFQFNGDTLATLLATQIFQNKTFDISLNTLKNNVNTAGHVPRNNGTQYIDGQLSIADLSNGTTGSGNIVLATAPSISSPTITGTDAGSETLQNKTFDISANVLKNSTNTGGHVPRNNGVQYVDGQLSAADLTNGLTGSGSIVLSTSPTLTTPTLSTPTLTTPVINGTPTGTSLQGTDLKLLTSGTIGSAGSTLCADANGGATTSSCAAIPNVNAGRNNSVCTTGTSNGATCTTAVNLDTTEADTNYKVGGIGCVTPSGYPFILGYSKSTTQVTVTISNGASAQAVASTCASLEVMTTRQ